MSSESSICRIDWRPSRMLCAALPCLGFLAAASVWLSALPLPLKSALVFPVFALGPWLARREWRQPVFSVNLAPDEGRMVLVFADCSVALSATSALVRGPLAAVSGRDAAGRIRRVLWWPDTLPASSRRVLRLASVAPIAKSGPALATMSG